MPNKGGALVALEEARAGRTDDECWPWTRYVRESSGYGQTWYKGKLWGAHRLAYALAHAQDGQEPEDVLPKQRTVDHECHTRVRDVCKGGKDCPHRRCVNPAHLRVVTRATNSVDGNSPHGENKRKTHCLRGHPLSGDNLRMIDKPGRAPSRECVTCRRERNRRSYARSDGAAKQRDRYRRKKRAQETDSGV
jgi:hypothetical protein